MIIKKSWVSQELKDLRICGMTVASKHLAYIKPEYAAHVVATAKLCGFVEGEYDDERCWAPEEYISHGNGDFWDWSILYTQNSGSFLIDLRHFEVQP